MCGTGLRAKAVHARERSVVRGWLVRCVLRTLCIISTSSCTTASSSLLSLLFLMTLTANCLPSLLRTARFTTAKEPLHRTERPPRRGVKNQTE